MSLDKQIIPLNDLSRQSSNRLQLLKSIEEVLDSGSWVHGPQHDKFEEEFARYLNANFAFGVASGTDALELCLRAIGCQIGSKIINVANSGGYTSIVAKRIGCEIIFCDVDSSNLLMNLEHLSLILTQDVSAVVVTHLYGNIVNVKEVKEICSRFGVPIIEDCAQALGGTVDNCKVGTIGDISAFSFYPTKNLGAIGDGGAVVTNRKDLAEKVERLRQYGWSEKYLIDMHSGMNSRLDEIQASILRIRLRNLETENSKRRKVIAKYKEALSRSPLKLVNSSDVSSAPHLAILLLEKDKDRRVFMDFMLENGVSTGIHYPKLDTHQPGLSISSSFDLPNSEEAVKRIVTIPLFSSLTEYEIEHVCSSLRNFN